MAKSVEGLCILQYSAAWPGVLKASACLSNQKIVKFPALTSIMAYMLPQKTSGSQYEI